MADNRSRITAIRTEAGLQNLRLSLADWKLGQDVLGESISPGTDVANWVRSNLM